MISEIAPATHPATPVEQLLPAVYHDFLDVFSKEEADTLPTHRPSDHHIVLEGDVKLGYCLLYNISQEELELVKAYLEEYLYKGFIKASSSPFALLVLFA